MARIDSRLDYGLSDEAASGDLLRGASARAVLIGLILALLVCLLATDITYRLRASRVSLGHLPMALWLPFLLLFLSNLGLKRIRPRWSLAPHELGLILCMGFIGGAFPTKNVAGRLVAVLATPYYKATPENRWGDYIVEHLRPWAVPSDAAGGVSTLWEGLPRGHSIPWEVWIGPLFWWFTFFFALFFACLCITVVLRKQWVEHERIVFPLAQLPIQMITDEHPDSIWPRFFRSGLFWVGFALAFTILCWNVLPRFSHRIPMIPIGPTFRTAVSFGSEFPSLMVKFNFVVAAFGYLTNLEVLLSIWLFHVLAIVEMGALNRIGITVSNDYVSGVLLQQAGGFVTLVLFGLIMARRHIGSVLREAWHPQSAQADADELLPYRICVVGLVLSVGYAVAWMNALGISLVGVTVQLGILFVYFLGLAKIVAETGLVYIETPLRTQELAAATLGPLAETPDHVAMALTANSVESHREYILPTLTHIARIHHSFRWRRRSIVGALCAAFVIGFAASVAYTLNLCYSATGAANIRHVYVFNNYGLRMFDRVVRWASAYLSFSSTELSFLAAGSAITLLLSFLRLRFLWWPLHPVGFTVGYVFPVRVTAFTVFLVWAFKSLVLRLGGVTLYRHLQPLFLGLLIGYTLGVGVSTFVDALWFPGDGRMVHTW